MANALAINPKEITELFNIGTQAIRVNYYPPCPKPERVIGLKSHSDINGLTILLQISDIEGLQIKKDGQWIPVKPLPNAFIINIGDILDVCDKPFTTFCVCASTFKQQFVASLY